MVSPKLSCVETVQIVTQMALTLGCATLLFPRSTLFEVLDAMSPKGIASSILRSAIAELDASDVDLTEMAESGMKSSVVWLTQRYAPPNRPKTIKSDSKVFGEGE